jgi:hypothetical protein
MFVLIGLGGGDEVVVSCQCYFNLVHAGKRKIFPLEVKTIPRMSIGSAVDNGWRRDVLGWKCPDCIKREESK